MSRNLQLADGIQPNKLAKTNKNNRIYFRRKQIIEN